jgi:hypothetical protein
VEDVQKTWWLPVNHEPRTPPSSINLERDSQNVHENFKLAIMMISAPTNYPDQWLDQLKIVEAELVADLREGWRKVPGGTEAPPADKIRHPWGNQCSHRRVDLSRGEDHRDRDHREEMSAAAAGPTPYQECDRHRFEVQVQRHKNSNICDNFRCALTIRTPGRRWAAEGREEGLLAGIRAAARGY